MEPNTGWGRDGAGGRWGRAGQEWGRLCSSGKVMTGLLGLPGTVGCSWDSLWQEFSLSTHMPPSSPRAPARLAPQARRAGSGTSTCLLDSGHKSVFASQLPFLHLGRCSLTPPGQPPCRTPELPTRSHWHVLPTLLPALPHRASRARCPCPGLQTTCRGHNQPP